MDGRVTGNTTTRWVSARDYLDGDPGANLVVTAAYHQPRSDAAANVRGYFTANPQEYYELAEFRR